MLARGKKLFVAPGEHGKMLSFFTNVNVLYIDPATEKLTFYATKSSKSKENSQTSHQ